MTTETQAGDLDIPESLKVANRKPLTAEQAKKVEAATAAKAAKTKTKSKPPAHKPSKSKPSAETELRPDGLREGSAGARLVDFVCRKQGATNAELCEAVGWKQCLPFLRKSCDQAGVKLRTEKKEGELTRYFGTKPAKKAKAAS